eukprot:TRINITY_DN3369_c0_g1_i3.p1 TRINITY_DN3369_c0_g1~~TRINITY_DN3369_c0_g1_i3.p1  ORF type:complete len:312 (+),score=44.26 TRINITY_DN3369_c0_g1_i3:80-1015(+)
MVRTSQGRTLFIYCCWLLVVGYVVVATSSPTEPKIFSLPRYLLGGHITLDGRRYNRTQFTYMVDAKSQTVVSTTTGNGLLSTTFYIFGQSSPKCISFGAVGAGCVVQDLQGVDNYNGMVHHKGESFEETLGSNWVLFPPKSAVPCDDPSKLEVVRGVNTTCFKDTRYFLRKERIPPKGFPFQDAFAAADMGDAGKNVLQALKHRYQAYEKKYGSISFEIERKVQIDVKYRVAVDSPFRPVENTFKIDQQDSMPPSTVKLAVTSFLLEDANKRLPPATFQPPPVCYAPWPYACPMCPCDLTFNTVPVLPIAF